MLKGNTISVRWKSGFSMIEIMITVIIISTCFLAIFRVFTICTATLSGAHSNVLASNILRNKMNGIRERLILEDGISVTMSGEEITSGGRKFKYTEDISKFKEETSKPSETPKEGGGEEKILVLCRVKLNLTWRVGDKSRALSLETILPAKDFRHEF